MGLRRRRACCVLKYFTTLAVVEMLALNLMRSVASPGG